MGEEGIIEGIPGLTVHSCSKIQIELNADSEGTEYSSVLAYRGLEKPLRHFLAQVQKQKAGDKNALDAQRTGESFTFAHSKSPPRERTAGLQGPLKLQLELWGATKIFLQGPKLPGVRSWD